MPLKTRGTARKEGYERNGAVSKESSGTVREEGYR